MDVERKDVKEESVYDEELGGKTEDDFDKVEGNEKVITEKKEI